MGQSIAKHTRQERYRLGAVLGCSTCLVISEYQNSNSRTELTNSLVEKARIIRARAFLSLMRLPNAVSDVKIVLRRNASREAELLLADIKGVQAYSKSVDKRLAKEVAKWVDTATTTPQGNDANMYHSCQVRKHS